MNSYLIFSVVLLLVKLSMGCDYCVYANMQFSCGAIYGDKVCFNGAWYSCSWDDHRGCYTCHCPYLPNGGSDCPVPIFDDRITYKLSEENIIYSDMVQRVVKTSEEYKLDLVVPSKEIVVGDYVWWPTKLSTDGPSEFEIVLVEYASVSASRSNCCWSIEIGSACEAKYCCGNGCCC